MSETRAVPFHCPYCGEEDLYPTETRDLELPGSRTRLGGGPRTSAHEDSHGAWLCAGCRRVFAVRLIGLAVPS